MKNMKLFLIVFIFIFVFCDNNKAQISLSFSTQINTACDGSPCNYNGPSILINEVMLTPSSGDGSIYGNANTPMDSLNGYCWGEWIELYNPNVCEPIDISCYFLGNNAPENNGNYGGGFRIPANTVVPPSGFVVIRGIHAPKVPSNLLVQNGGTTIEITANNAAVNVCISPGGLRLWFPNAGGWFAFYDDKGIPQDAISWYNQANSCTSCMPCVTSYPGCSNVTSLPSYDAIPTNRKTYITSQDPSLTMGESWRRSPDGGAWNSSSDYPTIGTCNAACNTIPVSSCNGAATVTAVGGTPPYKYLWNDTKASTSLTATGLCAGQYCVTVVDSKNNSTVGCVNITNYKPVATFNTTPLICDNNSLINLSQYVSPIGGVFSGTGISNQSFDPSIAGVGSHLITYIYYDTFKCGDTVTQNLIVNTHPTASISLVNILCNGDSTGSASINPISGDQPFNYLWNNGSTINIINNVSAGNYTVTISDSTGCSEDYSLTIKQPTALTLSVVHTNVTDTIASNGSATVFASGGTPNYTYQWNNLQNTPEINNLSVGQYFITVTDNNGCVDSGSVFIKVKEISTFYIPNTFTPNDNGLNDVFTPKGTNVDSNNFEMYIFDRWGNIMFHTTKWLGTSAEPWNGTMNNKGTIDNVVPDTYAYRIIMKEIEGPYHEYIGKITILQ